MSKCMYCYGDKALFWKDDQNSAFIDSKGEMLVYANGQDIRFHVDRCPMCGRRFDERKTTCPLSMATMSGTWIMRKVA